jgi:MFS family permease
MLTILCYSLFTFLCAFVTNSWQLAVLRVLCGIGIGGEQPVGGTFVAEVWPEDRRKMGAGYMHTGYYFGFFLAALANYFIGANFGWRWMFALGGAPALLVGWIRRGVHESATWQQQRGDVRRRATMGRAFLQLFSPAYGHRTAVNSLLFLVSIIGLWAGSIYVPAAVTQIAIRQGFATADAARLASYATGLLSVGTIIGCVALPLVAERLGRRVTMAVYFALMGGSIVVAFGYVFYITPNALAPFFAMVLLLGLVGANFAMYTLWIPEQYATECRGSAIGLTSSIGRFVGCAMVFLVGAGIAYFETLGTPVALTSLAFLLGLALLPLGEETRGRPLPV